MKFRAVLLVLSILIFSWAFASPARGDGIDYISGFPAQFETAGYYSANCGNFSYENTTPGESDDAYCGMAAEPYGEGFANVAGTALTAYASSSGSAVSSGGYLINEGFARAGLDDAGIIQNTGNTEVQVRLTDTLTSTSVAGTGAAGGSYSLIAYYGPYIAATDYMEDSYAIQYIWNWGVAGASGAACSPYQQSTSTLLYDSTCLSNNSVVPVDISLDVPNGDAFAVEVEAQAYAYGDANITVSDDPMTVELPDGATWGDSSIPVSYYTSNTVPEPPSPVPNRTGLLALAGLFWRRRTQRVGPAFNRQPPFASATSRIG